MISAFSIGWDEVRDFGEGGGRAGGREEEKGPIVALTNLIVLWLYKSTDPMDPIFLSG